MILVILIQSLSQSHDSCDSNCTNLFNTNISGLMKSDDHELMIFSHMKYIVMVYEGNYTM